jgi:hypothetical protein
MALLKVQGSGFRVLGSGLRVQRFNVVLKMNVNYKMD